MLITKQISLSSVCRAAKIIKQFFATFGRNDKKIAFPALRIIHIPARLPLQSRLDQVLSSDQGVVICFQLFNLLRFYSDTIGSHLSPDSALTGTLHEYGRITCAKAQWRLRLLAICL